MYPLDLTKITISEARTLLDRGEVSSVELAKEYIDRIRNLEKSIDAFVTVTEDQALLDAGQADKRIHDGTQSNLTGIPMQLKDNICYSGIPTTCSSKMLENFVPPFDATVSRTLKNENAILLGKRNLDEFAMGSSTENSALKSTKNPWNIDRVPGGSSGGPAAAVAASECMFSLGSDTGGSIR